MSLYCIQTICAGEVVTFHTITSVSISEVVETIVVDPEAEGGL